jgi:hypothetical protein
MAAESRTLAPSKKALTLGRREADALLQREPVIRDLEFHLLRGRWQLVGTKEHDPASKNQDDDADKGEKWLAHLIQFNRLTIARDDMARMAF